MPFEKCATAGPTGTLNCVNLLYEFELFSEFDEARDILLNENPSVFSTEAVNLPLLGWPSSEKSSCRSSINSEVSFKKCQVWPNSLSLLAQEWNLILELSVQVTQQPFLHCHEPSEPSHFQSNFEVTAQPGSVLKPVDSVLKYIQASVPDFF